MSLGEKLLTEDVRPHLVSDCVALVDREVGAKKGLSGFAVKSGYKIVKRLNNGRLVPKAINDLLPEFIQAVEPFYAEFEDSDSNNFVSFCSARDAELANALIAVTDRKAEHAKNQILKSVYNKLRPTAVRNIQQALPGLAEIVQRHAG